MKQKCFIYHCEFPGILEKIMPNQGFTQVIRITNPYKKGRVGVVALMYRYIDNLQELKEIIDFFEKEKGIEKILILTAEDSQDLFKNIGKKVEVVTF